MSSDLPRYVMINGASVTVAKTDGKAENLPEIEEPSVDSDGNVDYLTEADGETVKTWLMKTGSYLVYMNDWVEHQHLQRYSLTRFPKNYKLYIHFKGPKSLPRKDAYLYGSSRVNCFRSPEEFAPHANWLAHGCPKKEDGTYDCGCHYCSKEKQGEISARLKRHVGDLFSNTFVSRPSGTQPSRPVTRRTPPAQNAGPIHAKDYTKLNVTGEVTDWFEGKDG